MRLIYSMNETDFYCVPFIRRNFAFRIWLKRRYWSFHKTKGNLCIGPFEFYWD